MAFPRMAYIRTTCVLLLGAAVMVAGTTDDWDPTDLATTFSHHMDVVALVRVDGDITCQLEHHNMTVYGWDPVHDEDDDEPVLGQDYELGGCKLAAFDELGNIRGVGSPDWWYPLTDGTYNTMVPFRMKVYGENHAVLEWKFRNAYNTDTMALTPSDISVDVDYHWDGVDGEYAKLGDPDPVVFDAEPTLSIDWTTLPEDVTQDDVEHVLNCDAACTDDCFFCDGNDIVDNDIVDCAQWAPDSPNRDCLTDCSQTDKEAVIWVLSLHYEACAWSTTGVPPPVVPPPVGGDTGVPGNGPAGESNACGDTGDYDNSQGQRVLSNGSGDCTHTNNVCCGGGTCNSDTKLCEGGNTGGNQGGGDGGDEIPPCVADCNFDNNCPKLEDCDTSDCPETCADEDCATREDVEDYLKGGCHDNDHDNGGGCHVPAEGTQGGICGVGTVARDGKCVASYQGCVEACETQRGDYAWTCKKEQC